MAQTQANVAALFKETYGGALPIMFDKTDTFAARIKARPVEKAGPRTLRLPKKLRPGGQFRYFSQDGGDLGRGGGPVYEAATLTPLPILEAIEFNKSVEWNTSSDAISFDNATRDLLADGMEEFAWHFDAALNASATGVLATYSSGAGTTTVTTATPYRSRLLRIGSHYTEYDVALAAPLASNPRILTNNTQSGVITIDAAPGGAANTDVFLNDGLTGGTPSTLFSIPYHHNAATTGTYMGLTRASYPELYTPSQTVSGALLPMHFRIARNSVARLRGEGVFGSGSWAWYMSHEQRHAYEELGIEIIQFNKTSSREGVDLLFDPEMLKIDGLPVVVSNKWDPSRIDLVDFDNWGRGETKAVGLYESGDDTVFPIYGASGGIAAADIFYIATICQTFVDDPQRAAIIASLTVPSGY